LGKCGRKRILTKRDTRRLRRLARANRKLPSRKLATLYNRETGINVSRNLVIRELYRSGIRRLKPKKKPLLTKRNKSERLQFAIHHLNWRDEWSDVIFSDEKKFNVFSSDSGVRLWVDKCEVGTPAASLPTVKFSDSVMVWACFSSRGVGRLYFMSAGEIINGATYIEILEAYLLPTIKSHFPGNTHRRVIFQQDNAPCHTAKLVSEWFVHRQINVMKWPGQSADLNPIENLWAVIVSYLRYEIYSDRKSLIAAIIRIWYHKIERSTIEHLIASMPERMQQVKKRRGWNTDY
jgi:hypothetical protein